MLLCAPVNQLLNQLEERLSLLKTWSLIRQHYSHTMPYNTLPNLKDNLGRCYRPYIGTLPLFASNIQLLIAPNHLFPTFRLEILKTGLKIGKELVFKTDQLYWLVPNEIQKDLPTIVYQQHFWPNCDPFLNFIIWSQPYALQYGVWPNLKLAFILQLR